MPMLMTWWGPWWPHRPHNPPPLRLNIPQLTFATRLHWWYLNIWRLGMSNILLSASNIYFQHEHTYDKFLLSGANNMSLDILVILLANLFVYRCNKNDFCSALTPKNCNLGHWNATVVHRLDLNLRGLSVQFCWVNFARRVDHSRCENVL